VPEGKKLIEMIKGVGNTAEAKAAAKRGGTLRGGSLVQPTDEDLSSDKFLLNITLPA